MFNRANRQEKNLNATTKVRLEVAANVVAIEDISTEYLRRTVSRN